MAESKNVLLHGMSGRIGDLIIYHYHGKTYVRSMPEKGSVELAPEMKKQQERGKVEGKAKRGHILRYALLVFRMPAGLFNQFHAALHEAVERFALEEPVGEQGKVDELPDDAVVLAVFLQERLFLLAQRLGLFFAFFLAVFVAVRNQS